MKKTLATIILGLGLASCTPRHTVQQPVQQAVVEAPKGPQKVTHQDLLVLEQNYNAMNADYHRSRDEMERIVAQYDMLRTAVLAKDAGDHLKDDLVHVQKLYKGAVEDLFDHLDVYMVLSGVDTAQFQNVPANLGAVHPLFVGKGAAIKDHLSFEAKDALIRKAREAWRAYGVTPGTVQEGGGRLVRLEETTVEINKDTTGKIVGEGIQASQPGYKNVSKDLWARSTNRDLKDGEMFQYFLTAVKPSEGYDLPKPAETKGKRDY